MTTHLTLTEVELVPGSTIAYGIGIDDHDTFIKFAGDWRPLSHCLEAIEAGEDVEVEVDDWQILDSWKQEVPQ